MLTSTKISTVGRNDLVPHPDNQTDSAIHLFDLTTDQYFGEGRAWDLHLAVAAISAVVTTGC
jgi:hypothetical protein